MEPILIKYINKGASCCVFISKLNPNSKEIYATKKLKVDSILARKQFEREIEILKELSNHKNIIKLINYNYINNYYYITLEYCNGDSLLTCLARYKKKYKSAFTEEIVQYLMRQIVNGLQYIHKQGIIQRDMKLANILVKFYSKEDFQNINMLRTRIKISDFGISIKAKEAFSVTGSTPYADPRILKKLAERNDLKDSDGYDKSADIWSLGALCYEMITGKWLFNGRTTPAYCNNLEIGSYSLPASLSKELVSFLMGMIQYEPTKRLNIDQLANHDFLTKDIKSFTKISLDLLGSKVQGNNINVNIKNNSTVMDIVNYDNIQLSAINRILNLTPNDEEDVKIALPEPIKGSQFNKFNSKDNLEHHNIPNNHIINNIHNNIAQNNIINIQHNNKSNIEQSNNYYNPKLVNNSANNKESKNSSINYQNNNLTNNNQYQQINNYKKAFSHDIDQFNNTNLDRASTNVSASVQISDNRNSYNQKYDLFNNKINRNYSDNKLTKLNFQNNTNNGHNISPYIIPIINNNYQQNKIK